MSTPPPKPWFELADMYPLADLVLEFRRGAAAYSVLPESFRSAGKLESRQWVDELWDLTQATWGNKGKPVDVKLVAWLDGTCLGSAAVRIGATVRLAELMTQELADAIAKTRLQAIAGENDNRAEYCMGWQEALDALEACYSVKG